MFRLGKSYLQQMQHAFAFPRCAKLQAHCMLRSHNTHACSYFISTMYYQWSAIVEQWPQCDQVDDLAWCIMREISKLCYNPVEEDIVRARNQLKAAILFSQDNLSGMWSALIAPWECTCTPSRTVSGHSLTRLHVGCSQCCVPRSDLIKLSRGCFSKCKS